MYSLIYQFRRLKNISLFHLSRLLDFFLSFTQAQTSSYAKKNTTINSLLETPLFCSIPTYEQSFLKGIPGILVRRTSLTCPTSLEISSKSNTYLGRTVLTLHFQNFILEKPRTLSNEQSVVENEKPI